jgi:hypothetical protein
MRITGCDTDDGVQVGAGGAENLAAIDGPRTDPVGHGRKKFIDGELEVAA